MNDQFKKKVQQEIVMIRKRSDRQYVIQEGISIWDIKKKLRTNAPRVENGSQIVSF